MKLVKIREGNKLCPVLWPKQKKFASIKIDDRKNIQT